MITILDLIDKTRQLQEITDSIQKKVVDGFASRDAEIARLKAEIENSPNAATAEQVLEVFSKLDATLEDLVRTIPGTITGPGGDPD